MTVLYESRQYKQTSPQYSIPKSAIEKALRGLEKQDFEIINKVCDDIEHGLKTKTKARGGHAKSMFGRTSSLEAIAKLGIFLLAAEKYDEDPKMLNLRNPTVMRKLLEDID